MPSFPPMSEPPPSLGSFSGLSMQGGAAAAGGIIGTKPLQSAVDQLTRTVDSFESAVKKISQFTSQLPGAGMLGAGRNNGFSIPNGGVSAMPRIAPGLGATPPTYNGWGIPSGGVGGMPGVTPGLGVTPPGYGSSWQMPPGGVASLPRVTPGAGVTSPAYGNGWTGSPITVGAYQSMTSPGTTQPGYSVAGVAGGGAGGGSSIGGVLGSPSFGYGQSFGRMAYGKTVQAGGSLLSGIMATGQATFGAHVALNTLQFQSGLLMNGGTNNGNNSYIAKMALGTAGTFGKPQMLNDMAFNPQDAMAGYSIMQQMAGNANPYNTSMGRTAFGATAMMGYMNPAMGEAQAAGAIQQLYQPGTSFAMLQAGLGAATPRMVGGGMRSLPSVASNLISGFFPHGTSNNNLNQQLQPGGLLNAELAQLGYSQTQIQQLSPILQATNKLHQGVKGHAGLSTGKINQLFKDISSTNPGKQHYAKSVLSNYHIQESALSRIKSTAGTQSAQIADTQRGFISGLDAATRALQDFRTGLGKFLNQFHINTAIGAGQGASATSHNLGGAMWHWATHEVGSWLGNMLHGGAATPAPTASHAKNAQGSMVTGNPARQAVAAVHAAESQIGVPYKWGAEIPGKGFDCGGLVQWSYRQAGLNLPRTPEEQFSYLQSRQIPMNQLREGDLVFATGPGTPGRPAHVGIMLSGNKVIEAPYSGGTISVHPFHMTQWIHAARPSMGMRGGTPTRKNAAQLSSKNTSMHGGRRKHVSHKSGYVNPFRDVGGLVPERIDQGADFSGNGPVLAIGDGVVLTSTTSPSDGWGGGYINYRLTSGPAAGKIVYVAEGITPRVKSGAHIHAGEIIADMSGGIETGWAAGIGTLALSATKAGGGIGGGNLPGGGTNPTRLGLNFDQLLVALGVKAAPNMRLQPGGRIPKGFPHWSRKLLGSSSYANGGSSGGGGGGGGGSVRQVTSYVGSGATGAGAGFDLGTGDTTGEGSTTELAAYQGAISGGIGGGSGYYGVMQKTTSLQYVPGSGGSGGGGGGATGGKSHGHGTVQGPTGPLMNSQAIANALASWGLDKAAVAGVMGSIYQESHGNPHAYSNAGGGLFGLTIANGGRPGGGSLSYELGKLHQYIMHNGSISDINKHATSAAAAAIYFATQYERAGVPDMSNRVAAAKNAFKLGYASGGHAPAGTLAMVGERGPELVRFNNAADVFSASQSAKMMSTMMAEAPYKRSPSEAYAYSHANPIFQGGRGSSTGGGGVTLNFGKGSIVINMPPTTGHQSLPTGPNARAMARAFAHELGRLDLYSAIAQGANS